MFQWMNKELDKISEFLASRKGLLPLIGIFLILLNFVLQFLHVGWVANTNLCLHLGLVIAIVGFMLVWVL